MQIHSVVPICSMNLLQRRKKCDVFAVRQENVIKYIEEIGMIEFLPIAAVCCVDLWEKTEQDDSLQKVKYVNKVGWPDEKEKVPPEIKN